MGTLILDGKKIEISPLDSVLIGLMKAGISIHHKCGGRAQCGTCRFEVITGAENFTKIKEDEKHRLEARGFPKNYRLGCQSHLFGTAEIRIPPE